jgi:hypothetical protein
MFRGKIACFCAVGALFLGSIGLRFASAQTLISGESFDTTGVFMGTAVATSIPLLPFEISGDPGESGTLAQAVIKDGNSGDLDFLYQWTNNSSPSVPYVTTTDKAFGGFVSGDSNGGAINGAALALANPALAVQLALVGFNLTPTETAPYSVTLNPGPVGSFSWQFTNGAPGGADWKSGASYILVIQTTATGYNKLGTAGVIDEASQNVVPSYQPVPEPSMLNGLAGLLVMGGLGGIGLVWRRKR